MSVCKKNVIAIIILLICFPLTIAYGYYFKNFIRQAPLPLEYVRYKYLNKAVNTKSFEIVELLDGEPNNIWFEDPILIDDFTIIKGTPWSSDNRKSFYYKIDKNGILKDSLLLNSDEYVMKFKSGYLIHRNFYRDWTFSGDSLKSKYIFYNQDLKLDSLALIKKYKSLMEKSDASLFTENDTHWDQGNYEEKREVDNVKFLIDKKWVSLYGEDLYELQDETDQNDDGVENQLANKLNLEIQNKNLLVKYFFKTRRDYFDKKAWDGLGYFNYEIGSESLQFKHPMAIKSNGEYDFKGLKIFKHPSLKFVIIGIGSGHILVIRSKEI